MLQPKRVKYRSHHRGRRKGLAVAGSTINVGEYALKATEAAWITARQLEAARRAMTRHARRGGRLWIRIFPDKSVTSRAAETRMGSGKGAVDHWVAVVKPGRIMFEIAGVPEDVAREALRLRLRSSPFAPRSSPDTVYRHRSKAAKVGSMEINDIRALSDAELQEESDSTRRELMNLRFRAATMQLANVNEIRKGRKRIARIKTVMRERELAKATV